MPAYEIRISVWSSDVCSADLKSALVGLVEHPVGAGRADIARKGPNIAAFHRIIERAGDDIAVLVARDGSNIRHEQYRNPRHAPVEHGGMDVRFLDPDQAIVEPMVQCLARVDRSGKAGIDIIVAQFPQDRSEEHTSELQSQTRTPYA